MLCKYNISYYRRLCLRIGNPWKLPDCKLQKAEQNLGFADYQQISKCPSRENTPFKHLGIPFSSHNCFHWPLERGCQHSRLPVLGYSTFMYMYHPLNSEKTGYIIFFTRKGKTRWNETFYTISYYGFGTIILSVLRQIRTAHPRWDSWTEGSRTGPAANRGVREKFSTETVPRTRNTTTKVLYKTNRSVKMFLATV
jgi:hypothetical protein